MLLLHEEAGWGAGWGGAGGEGGPRLSWLGEGAMAVEARGQNGHVRGCAMGMGLACGGHLYVAGVHLQTMKGIDSPWVGRTKRGTAKGGNRRAAK